MYHDTFWLTMERANGAEVLQLLYPIVQKRKTQRLSILLLTSTFPSSTDAPCFEIT